MIERLWEKIKGAVNAVKEALREFKRKLMKVIHEKKLEKQLDEVEMKLRITSKTVKRNKLLRERIILKKRLGRETEE